MAELVLRSAEQFRGARGATFAPPVPTQRVGTL